MATVRDLCCHDHWSIVRPLPGGRSCFWVLRQSRLPVCFQLQRRWWLCRSHCLAGSGGVFHVARNDQDRTGQTHSILVHPRDRPTLAGTWLCADFHRHGIGDRDSFKRSSLRWNCVPDSEESGRSLRIEARAFCGPPRAFLMTLVYQCDVIVCAMFLTGQASNF